MYSEKVDLQPVFQLLEKHTGHTEPYETTFRGINLILHPEVFNPTYTKVSGFLLDNIEVHPGESCLEMFSGIGAISFYVSRYASRIVGVDISARAVEYANMNTSLLGLDDKVSFRQGSMWDALSKEEEFDVIFGNPPLLPVEPDPENILEMAVADSPEMKLTQEFIKGSARHLAPKGRMYMPVSNACEVYVGDPLDFVHRIGLNSGLNMQVKAEWDVGYEIYRVLEFHPLLR